MSKIKKSLHSTQIQQLQSKIIKYNFLFPIVSIIVLSIILMILFFSYAEKFKENSINDLEQDLLAKNKLMLQHRVDNLVSDIKNIDKLTKQKTKQDLKYRVNNMFTFIDNLYKSNKNKSDKEIKEIILQVLHSQTYNNGRGYFFAYNRTSGIVQTHAMQKMVGKNVKNLKNQNSNITVYQRNEKVLNNKDQEGYFSLYFPKPNNPNKLMEKIDFIKYNKRLNWVIGTGEYVEDIKHKLEKAVLKRVMVKLYGKNGYFWILDSTGKLLANPLDKKDIGKNILNLHDSKQNFFIKCMVKQAKTNSKQFCEYEWLNPVTHKVEPKLGYARYFKNWNWIVGSGIYKDDIKRDIDIAKLKMGDKLQHFYKIILVIVLVSIIIALLFSYFLSKILKNIFIDYKQNFETLLSDAIEDNRKKDQVLQQQSKMAQMGEMIGAIAHQWRQPLNAITTSIQNLKYDYKDGNLKDEKFIDKFIEQNKQTIKFMSKTIDDFRGFFRVEKEKQKFSIQESTKSVADMLNAQLQNYNITLSINNDEFIYNGLQSEYQQVILNLINNAKDALIENNIKEPMIIIEIDSIKQMICVIDNAGGVPEEILNRVFEPYFTTKEQGKGTGMGLYMSKMIIEDNMQGSLTVENINNGAKFCIDLSKDK